MMKSEFFERTGFEPDEAQYHYIEESYYLYPGNKDEFCKQWVKDNKDGHWERELYLWRCLDDQKEQMQKTIDEQEDNLKWYRKQFDTFMETQKKLKEAEEKLARLERIFRRMFDADPV